MNQESGIKPKLVVILGPTASGKTRLAVELARRFDGEIVSADSRQVYRGMDIGTGKDLAEYGNVPYHLIDIVDPAERFTVSDFKIQADLAIEGIARRGKVPMLVGGSGLYLQAVVDDFQLDRSGGVDQVLRERLEKMAVSELYTELQRLDPVYAATLNNSDRHNKRRLIRYIEINMNHGGADSSKPFGTQALAVEQEGEPGCYDALILGLMPAMEVMEGKIKKRLLERLEKEDMAGEVRRLLESGVTARRLKELGLEYRFITEYLEGRYGFEEMAERLFIAIRQFAKRQLTWFKRWEGQGRTIHWVEDGQEAARLIRNFLR